MYIKQKKLLPIASKATLPSILPQLSSAVWFAGKPMYVIFLNAIWASFCETISHERTTSATWIPSAPGKQVYLIKWMAHLPLRPLLSRQCQLLDHHRYARNLGLLVCCWSVKPSLWRGSRNQLQEPFLGCSSTQKIRFSWESWSGLHFTCKDKLWARPCSTNCLDVIWVLSEYLLSPFAPNWTHLFQAIELLLF